MSPEEHRSRVARLQETLREAKLDGALLLAAVDVLYYAGTRQNGALFVPATGDPTLVVRKSFARAKAEGAVRDVRPFPPSKELAAALRAAGKVGTPFDAAPQATLDWWRRQLPAAELVDLSGVVRGQRSVKSPLEIAAQRESARRLGAVFAQIPTFLREGMRELDLSVEIEQRLRRAGAEGAPRMRGFNNEMWMGIAVAGAAAAEPGCFDGPVVGQGLHAAYPAGSSEHVIRAGEPVLFDFCFIHKGYVSDMTRTAVVGELPAELVRAHAVAVAIQDEVAAGLVPGAVPAALWERARAHAEREGLGDKFMGPPGDQARFVAHGLGLELDELPILAPGFKDPLVAGQVVAVEPKFVFPGLGAVGVENDYAVAAGGGDRLCALPDEIMKAGGDPYLLWQ
jgi:Xaa-Pro aminopeptidase